MGPASQVPLQKNVVLVGAGNAHLRFVKMFGMRRAPGVAVTLVNESTVVPYSAMVPGCIAGDYAWDEITIDLVRLCRWANVRFVAEAVTGIDVTGHRVTFAGRPELRYDVLCLGLGSLPACPPGMSESDSSWLMRPLGGLIARLKELEHQLRQAPRAYRFVIVGGGASGCELALAIHKRFSGLTGFHLTLLQSNARLLPQFRARTARIFTRLLEERGITVRLGARVIKGGDGFLQLEDGERLEHDTVLWATNAAPSPVLATSGLPLSEAGFLKVADTLQSVGDPAVFGTGDCITITSYPSLQKNGVYAVREGGVLFENVPRWLTDRRLRRFRPQRRCLCLMNTADGEAVFNYGWLTGKGRLVRRLKDRIDRAWIDKFVPTASAVERVASEEEAVAMRCGGCGSKISGDVLSAVLKRIDPGEDPRILVGCRDAEDAAVHRMQPELFGSDSARLVEVQTVDYFKAFVDDPYLFGRIAAINAVSDLYAMNARPFSALAVATLPYARGPVLEGMLFELLSGAVRSLREAGVVLTGGHTTEGSELALGFAVTGHAEEDRLFQKGNLRPGDLLVLTKPLGSGALLAAWMRGACRAEWFDRMIAAMLQTNRAASEVLARNGVRACTDVTGFGLAGHLLEMLDASHVSARVAPDGPHLYEGFTEVVHRGIVSTLHRDNAKVACRVHASTEPPAWLFDPQTSGGLLAGVSPDLAEDVVRHLRQAGYPDTAIIGEVIPVGAAAPHLGLADKG